MASSARLLRQCVIERLHALCVVFGETGEACGLSDTQQYISRNAIVLLLLTPSVPVSYIVTFSLSEDVSDL